jgi:hypothetical protein
MPVYGSFGYNFPTPPRKSIVYNSFPNDLVAPGRNFYTEITFMSYNVNQQLTSTRLFTPTGGIRLPIPRKLNDTQTLVWNAVSGTSAAAGLLGSFLPNATRIAQSVATMGSAFAGAAVNPLLFMTFDRPNYKDHTLSWSLAPNTEAESRTIVQIVNNLKFNSLPRQDLGGAVLRYPNIAFVKLYPDDMFTMTFRPCAVTGVSVDYTGAGSPTFFKNGAPAVVNLNLSLQEIQLWDQTNYNGEEGVINSYVQSAMSSIGNFFGGL